MSREIRFYADSAVASEVGELLADGLVHGVTTNPTILERAGRSVRDIPALYERWEAEGAHEIFFQAWGDDKTEMLRTARDILAVGPRAVVKVPATRIGFAVASVLVAEGSRVLVTAVYSQAQALAAASMGAHYVAPYLGRLKDAGRDGVAEIAAMARLIAGTGTEVLAASLRTPADIVDLAALGVRHFTAGPAVILAALQSDVSDRSAEDFEAAVRRGL